MSPSKIPLFANNQRALPASVPDGGLATLLKVSALGGAGVACTWQVTQTLAEALSEAGLALWTLTEMGLAALSTLF